MLKHRGNEDDHAESYELHLAVQKDNPQHLSALLCQDKYKQYIESRSGWGVPVTPLRLAASQGYLECVKILLANGAEVDCLDVKAQTPLFAAVSARHLDCVRELLQAGANPCGSAYNNCSPVLAASRDGQIKILKELLDYGADANIRSRKIPKRTVSSTGCSGPLYLAAVYGHLECFRTLLLYGAEPNYNCTDQDILERVKRPVSVLEICLKHGCNPEFIQLLINFGAHIYLPNIQKYQPLAHRHSLELLEREKEYPRSLMSQCRVTIRRSLYQMGRLRLIDQLKIPQRIVRYLQHQND
ncbi:ankyrin repeat and SOCS box protein 12-like [Hyla sarda]|uniref:ankyrin repeat and SOCS box protein 12-like n=1 Tax=Hyla sarda TaxID=327740 RepID=UPI0024C42FE8|nr:ankyrin repeat and SOCS box protein 12-like [Hyla sarda]XP_056397487.1 ankyrin repeat and SOCS box protein 12-like [Hyla sarda]XP_056397488.1 ankyrin repeat and SOCS box protein 12-like [Hyla sarda]XP_056397489.1 ankyrin repeat and SOCS box protein 12-like [Hyla sarda]XP_056397490.1 ankyrin repeat and SOCS box protein 12-like [Hyla sarda]